MVNEQELKRRLNLTSSTVTQTPEFCVPSLLLNNEAGRVLNLEMRNVLMNRKDNCTNQSMQEQ